jgi:hypothetical protein
MSCPDRSASFAGLPFTAWPKRELGLVLQRMRGEDTTPFAAVPRAGIVANGITHLLVAWLALQVALGHDERADQAGALQTIAGSAFGRALLWLVAGCFAAVVVWRAYEAAVGHRYASSSAKRTRKRLFASGQVLVYGALTVLAAHVASVGSAGNVGPGVTARLLALPYGQATVVVIGVGVLVTGIAMIVQGWRMAFTEDMDLQRAGPRLRAFVERAGQVGSVTKGLAVGIIGVLIVVAAATYQPSRAQGLDVALKTIAAQPFGTVALLAVAVGIASFGVFAFFDAVYHRV